MTHKILKEILNLRTDLSDLVRLGSANDGGYVVNKSSLQNSDVLYTYGVSNDYNFEINYVNSFPGKKVRMFDHTVNYPYEVYNNLFFIKEPLEINEDDSKNSFLNHLNYFSDWPIQGDKDINKKIFLKIDVEGYEYEFFSKLSQNLNLLNNVTGMVVEFHNLNCLTNYILFHKIIIKLLNFFTVTHVHGNNHGPAWTIDGEKYPEVLEISFCKKELSKNFEITSISYPLKGLDSPCHPRLPDHEIKL